MHILSFLSELIYRQHLTTFLEKRCCNEHDTREGKGNACERALRPSVIHRKVMGSFRSDWGAQTYAALATVLNTAKPNGENAFQKLVRLMGSPILPFLLQPDFAV
jgi:hypothetical protein